MSIAEDVKLTEEQKTEWDGVGDAKTVSGNAFLRQSISVSALQAYRNVAATPTPEALEELRGDIEQAVSDNVHSRDPIDVEISEMDYESSTVTFDISTQRVSLTESTTFE